MKVIIVNDKHAESKTLSLGFWTRTLLSLCLLGAPLSTGVYIGYQIYHQDEVLDTSALSALKERSDQQQAALIEVKRHAQQQLQALTLRLSELQSRLVRLDALGERVTSITKLDNGEFDFSQPPAVGGPEGADTDVNYEYPDFIENINQLLERVDNRAQQLEILQSLLANQKIQDDIFLAGRPIAKGWMSSSFGHRADPFTGRVAMHEGVDFAGKEGSPVVSVAAGVVTWSDKRSGYGQLVEINHGSGYITRYAHNKENLVNVGDIVKKGQEIALMGSSGRSTGPHVHFEVYKHGRPVDPAAYIHRTNR